MKKYLLYRARGSFTIEAAVLLPIILALTVALILIAAGAHTQVRDRANTVAGIISRAPMELPEDSALINGEMLDGRNTLLKYKLARDGLKTIIGGLSDE